MRFLVVFSFIDGNGRTSRLLLKLELMKDGFLLVIIKVEKCLEYDEALDKAHTTEKFLMTYFARTTTS